MTAKPGNVSVRRATPLDAKAIAACVQSAYEHYVERIGQPPGPMLENYDHVVKEREVYVAELDGAIVGILVLRETAEGFLLDNVAVNPQHQGEGIGSTLLELAESRAKSAGFASIYLYTHEKMTENQARYAKIGYNEYDRRT